MTESDDDEGLSDLRGLFEDVPLASSDESSFVFPVDGRRDCVIMQDPKGRKRGLEGVEGTESKSATGGKIWDTSVLSTLRVSVLSAGLVSVFDSRLCCVMQVVLSRYLATKTPSLQGTRAVELGAGCGLCSVVLAMLGAAVVATDRKEIVPLLQRNAEANAANITGSLVAEEYLWGSELLPSAITTGEGELDVIAACDCIYDQHLGEPFLQSLERLAGEHTLVYVGNDQSVGRSWKTAEGNWVPAYGAFLDLAARSFHVEPISLAGLGSECDRENVALFRLRKKPP